MASKHLQINSASGFLISIPGHPSIEGDYDPYFLTNPFITYELRLEKYFPYDNGNGDPIYDEDTGLNVRDPITGL